MRESGASERNGGEEQHALTQLARLSCVLLLSLAIGLSACPCFPALFRSADTRDKGRGHRGKREDCGRVHLSMLGEEWRKEEGSHGRIGGT